MFDPQEIASKVPVAVSTPRSRSAFERRQDASQERRLLLRQQLKEEAEEARAEEELRSMGEQEQKACT